MKLNTLLLASAATLVASTAFAADLPSKKAAPAAGSVQVCKVGGMTGFTLPGSDTCFQISGRVTADFQNSDTDDVDYLSNDTIFGPDGGVGYRINLDARSNSEVGVVRSFISLTNGLALSSASNTDEDHFPIVTTSTATTYARKAFIQVGGFTAGIKDSIADIAGTQGNLFGSGWSQPSRGVDYQADIGALHVGVELGDALVGGDEMPDVIGHLSGKVGGAGFALAVAMADDGADSGTAFMGSVNFAAGPAKVFAWGGVADEAASSYITSVAGVEDAMTYGAGVTFNVAAATSISVQAVHWEGTAPVVGEVDQNDFGIYLSHALAKNLTLQPEVLVRDGELSESTQALLRIQRDF